MWGIIVFLTLGLYNMFKNPQTAVNKTESVNFSNFLTEVENGRVVQVEIKGNNIEGILSDGKKFTNNILILAIPLKHSSVGIVVAAQQA